MKTNLYSVKYFVYSTVDGHESSRFNDLSAAMDHARDNSAMLEHSFRVVARYTHRTDSRMNTDIDIATFNGSAIARAGDKSRLIW